MNEAVTVSPGKTAPDDKESVSAGAPITVSVSVAVFPVNDAPDTVPDMLPVVKIKLPGTPLVGSVKITSKLQLSPAARAPLLILK